MVRRENINWRLHKLIETIWKSEDRWQVKWSWYIVYVKIMLLLVEQIVLRKNEHFKETRGLKYDVPKLRKWKWDL